MKKSVVFSLAATVLLAGCAKEISTPEVVVTPNGETYTLSIGIPETKTQLGDLDGTKRKVYWSDGDKIAVNGNESVALSNVAAKSTVAQFTFSAAQTAPFNVLYPASILKDASTVTLPAQQTYAEGSFADGACPMAGYSADGNSVALNYLCAVLNVPLKKANDSHNITSVKFASAGSEQVSGDFTINYGNASLTGAGGSNFVTVTLNEALSETAKDIYIVVPAATYASGFSLVIADASGHEMTKSKNVSVTLEAGHVYNFEELAFTPSLGPADLTISSAEDLVQLAVNYNKGEYTGRELTVNMNANVSFDSTSSSAFAATGGIGYLDEYFHGTFNGNGYSISNYSGSAPLFAYIGSSGVVKNLVIDSSCSFEFTPSAEADSYFGAIAGYHKGLIDNVTVNAGVAFAGVADLAQLSALGGIVGRCTVGTISNCKFAGALEVPAGFASTAKLLVGGIVGYTSNNDGVISNCTLDGTIGVAAKVTSTDKSNPYMIVGGIVGYNSASVSECVTNDHPTVETLYSGANGTIVIKTDTSYNTAVGGFVGENASGKVSSCENNASIFVTIFKGAGDASARYLRSGGIVGKNDANGVVSSCTNNAKVQHRSNPRLQSIAGIVGHNSGTVTSCTNNADINHMTTGVSGVTNKGGRIVNIAGVIGDNLEGAVVSDLHNTASIQISAMESNYDATNDKPVCEVRMGGVVAYNFVELDGGANKDITNSGQVYFSPNFDKQFIGYELGGIAGYSTASVKNAKNSGYVHFRWNSNANVASKVYLGGIVGKMEGDGTISGCVNEGGESNAGEVYLNVLAGAAKHTDNYVGGILGYTANNVMISECTNSGYIHGGNSDKQNGTSCYIGGIVASLSGNSSISWCTNTGIIYNNHSSNSAGTNNTAFNGGIAGWVSGTAEGVVSISNCEHKTTNLSPRRGYSGGIVGYANYASLESNNVTGIGFAGSAYFIGGVAGWAVNSTITSCNYTGTSIVSSQIQRAGGIVAKLGAGTLLNSCSSSAATITGPTEAADGVTYVYGAIAGESAEGSTIQNCHYPASGTINGGGTSHTWQICGDSNFSDGGGNAADL